MLDRWISTLVFNRMTYAAVHIDMLCTAEAV
jgi:hypothetical protein